MSIPTVAVTCRAFGQDGNPINGATFRFMLTRMESYNGVVVPQAYTATTDATGVVVVDLFPNELGVVGSQYTVKGRDEHGRKFLDSLATIPNAACDLDDVLMLDAYGVVVAAPALPATSAPLQDEAVASIGVSAKYAREDHVHPLQPGSSPSTTTPAMNGTASAGTEGAFARGDHVHPTDTTLAAQSEVDALTETVAGKAPLANPAFTGVPTVPTAAPGTSTTQAASTAFVKAALDARTEVWNLSMSDLSTALTTGTLKAYMRAPKAATLIGVRLSLAVASTSGAVQVDVRKNGTTMFSTKPQIDANQKTSVTSGTPAVISVSSIADDDELAFDISTAGTGAKGLIAVLIVRV